MEGKILIVDDNEDVLLALNFLLEPYVEKVKVTALPEKIIPFMDTFRPDVILLDMNFSRDASSGQEGMYWLEKILEKDPQAVVVFMTAYVDTERAVRAIRSGATDYVAKPWEKDKLLATIASAVRLRHSRVEVMALKERVSALSLSPEPPPLIGESPVMQELFHTLKKVAITDANILLLGENGTGKDLVARTICYYSLRSGAPFITIDLGAIPESLFESELFGYEKGAFTDARKTKAGRIETASGGTLFLDEIGNLSPAMQSRLLTVLEKKEISRLGSTHMRSVDLRLISATNADIYRMTEEGNFRRDLLYRINTIEMVIPPLRERGEDILLLAEHFLSVYNLKYKKGIEGYSREVRNKLLSYHWPGNVRELQHAIERAVILSEGNRLQAGNFMLDFRPVSRRRGEESLNLALLERTAIEDAMRQSGGNISRAAGLLGITRYTLYRKLEKYKV